MTPRAVGKPAAQADTRQPAPRAARLRRLPLPVLLGLMLVGGLCALLALNTASAAQELKQRALTESNTALSDQAQQLLRDLAAKQAPASLAAAAAAQGLVPNPNPAFLRLNADGTVTVLGSPAPARLAPPPAAPKPTATASPGATPSKPATSSASRPAPSSTSRAAASSAARPSPSTPARSSARPSEPVVTVTVTRPAAEPTSTPTSPTPSPTRPSPTKTSPTKTTAPGGPR